MGPGAQECGGLEAAGKGEETGPTQNPRKGFEPSETPVKLPPFKSTTKYILVISCSDLFQQQQETPGMCSDGEQVDPWRGQSRQGK